MLDVLLLTTLALARVLFWIIHSYLKEDSCNAPGDHATAFKQYGLMRDGLNKTGRPILFSLCGWSAWYGNIFGAHL